MNSLDNAQILSVLVIVLLGFLLPLLVLVLLLRASRQKREMLSRERLAAIEKGMELPFFESLRPPQLSPLGTSFVLMGVGIGLSLFFWLLVPSSQAGVSALGLIPGMIGVGMLIHWLSSLHRSRAELRKILEDLC